MHSRVCSYCSSYFDQGMAKGCAYFIERNEEKYMEEIWKDIKGLEGYYQISNKGRVKSLGRHLDYSGKAVDIKEKIISGYVSSYGYRVFNLSKDGKRIRLRANRAVAEAFIPNPENKPVVNHIDSNRQNDNVENLEWATYQENTLHANVIGVKNRRGTKTMTKSEARKCITSLYAEKKRISIKIAMLKKYLI